MEIPTLEIQQLPEGLLEGPDFNIETVGLSVLALFKRGNSLKIVFDRPAKRGGFVIISSGKTRYNYHMGEKGWEEIKR